MSKSRAELEMLVEREQLAEIKDAIEAFDKLREAFNLIEKVAEHTADVYILEQLNKATEATNAIQIALYKKHNKSTAKIIEYQQFIDNDLDM